MQYGISFDFWNTLYANGDEALRHQQRISFYHKIISAYKLLERGSVEEVFEWSQQYFIQSWQEDQITPTAEKRIRLMAERLDVSLSSDDINKIACYFGNLIRQIPPREIAHLKTCVNALSERFPLGIISDTGYISGRYIRRFLDSEDLLTCFRSLIFSDEHRHCKPHASVFHLTCRNLEIDSSRLIHIGDLETTDVRGVLESGGISIKFTGVSGSDGEGSASGYIVKNYQELPDLIDMLTRR